MKATGLPFDETTTGYRSYDGDLSASGDFPSQRLGEGMGRQSEYAALSLRTRSTRAAGPHIATTGQARHAGSRRTWGHYPGSL